MRGRRRFTQYERITVYQKYNGKCALCGRYLKYDASCMTLDHIIPLSKGGTNDIENLQLSCKRCNLLKSDYMPFEFVRESWKSFWRSCISFAKYLLKKKGDVVA